MFYGISDTISTMAIHLSKISYQTSSDETLHVYIRIHHYYQLIQHDVIVRDNIALSNITALTNSP